MMQRFNQIFFKVVLSGILVIVVLSFQFRNDVVIKEGVRLHRIISSECNGELDPYLLHDRVISKSFSGDSIFLTLGLNENCCINFNPGINFSEGILDVNLDTTSGAKLFCSCNCCFELTLVLTGIRDTGFLVKVEDKILPVTTHPYPTQPIQYKIYEGDTINLVNIYGLMQGLWIKFDDSTGHIRHKGFYAGVRSGEHPVWRESFNSEGIRESKRHGDTSWTFYENQTVRSQSLTRKKYAPDYLVWSEETAFYPNGNKKHFCIQGVFQRLSESDSCQYWDENGNVLDHSP